MKPYAVAVYLYGVPVDHAGRAGDRAVCGRLSAHRGAQGGHEKAGEGEGRPLGAL